MPESRTLGEAQAASFGHVLFQCARLLDEIAQERVNAGAGRRVARPSVMRLVPFLTREGVRPADLARRLDVSRQAVGQSIALLEERGFVTDRPDPSDGRGRLVCLTPAGEDAFRIGLSVLAELEGHLARRVTPGVMSATFAGLQSVLEVLLEWERDGAPAGGTAKRRGRPRGRA